MQQDPNTAGQPRIADEIRKMAAEPLLPIEKKLIGWSLGLGIVLLVVLVAVAKMFVPH
ncbi:MAG TPA: hypothetical protein VFO24_06985 [Usitatibacter sp.]|nr:hypothetical protein [Usitatibacter sp.]